MSVSADRTQPIPLGALTLCWQTRRPVRKTASPAEVSFARWSGGTRARRAGGDLAHTGGPFPDRLHVNEVVFKFMWEQTEAVVRWAAWAGQEVASWPEDIAVADGTAAGVVLQRAAAARAPG
jgi:hypothetical protein